MDGEDSSYEADELGGVSGNGMDEKVKTYLPDSSHEENPEIPLFVADYLGEVASADDAPDYGEENCSAIGRLIAVEESMIREPLRFQ